MMNKVNSWIVSLILLLGFVGTIFHIDPVPGQIYENRTMNPPPKSSLREPSLYVAEADLYLNDNFGFRKILIYTHSIFRHFVLNANSSENQILLFFNIQE